MKCAATLVACLAVGIAQAQFVWPKASYHDAERGLYTEDPFIVKYRQEFFAVFRGDFKRFEKAYAEIESLAKEDTKSARARVWLGNGMTIRAGLLFGKGKVEEGKKLAMDSRKVLDEAVRLKPEDPNIIMMRAATLYVQGQYLPEGAIDRTGWQQLANDCEWFIKYLGPERIRKVSTHVRGEAYGELGIAQMKLGQFDKARASFQKVIELCPDTDYSARARKEIESLPR